MWHPFVNCSMCDLLKVSAPSPEFQSVIQSLHIILNLQYRLFCVVSFWSFNFLPHFYQMAMLFTIDSVIWVTEEADVFSINKLINSHSRKIIPGVQTLFFFINFNSDFYYSLSSTGIEFGLFLFFQIFELYYYIIFTLSDFLIMY